MSLLKESLKNHIRTIIVFISFIFFSVALFSQEICDDGIDNDGDGLIDCADPDCKDQAGCEGTFSCESALFQVLSGQLNVFDPATLSYTPIGPDNANYNGTGYNIQDGYIYGQINSGGERHIWKIFNDGTYEDLGIVINGNDFPSYKADFDQDGNLMTYENGVLYYVDVSATAPYTYTTTNLTNLTGGAWPSANDITYDYIYDKFYLLTSGRELWVIDENNATIRMVADLDTAFASASGGNGAAWSDGFGNLYFFNNSSGNIYKVELDATGDNVVYAGFFVAGTPNGNNDGMSCPLATIPEICGNGLDDDGDGLTDCDDPDCDAYAYCNFTETTEGNESGLESNERLADKIAKRNYKRSKDNTRNLDVKTSERRLREETFELIRTDDPTVLNFIPIDPLNNSATYMSTPTDLLDITNAIDVYSVDYFVNQSRVGSILALETENGVYEHVKYICDRLHGTQIVNIWNYEIDESNPFIVTKYMHENGLAEYASNISFYRNDNGNYTVESHWNLSDYSYNEEYFTFQVWANSMFNLEQMMLEVINLIEVESYIETYNFTDIPNLYIRDFSYDNHVLTMNVVNNSESEYLVVSGNAMETESSDTEDFQEAFTLNGDILQTIEFNTEGIYAMGITLSHPSQTVPDGIYFADGPWGVDYVDEEATVANFEVVADEMDMNTNGYKLERAINVNGTVKDGMAIYRSMNAGFKPMDMSAYNVLSFNAQGNMDVEVTIIKESVAEWSDQLRKTITIHEDATTYNLDINDFYSPLGGSDWSDVKMIVFKIYGNGTSFEDYNLSIENLTFRYDEQSVSNTDLETIALNSIYPNPMRDFTTFQIHSKESANMTFKLLNTAGQIMNQFNHRLETGNNEIRIENNNYAAGIYFYEIQLENGEMISGKISILAK